MIEQLKARSIFYYEGLKRQINKERQSELKAHKKAMALRKLTPTHALNIFADGDSWNDYPLYDDMMDWLKKDAMRGTTILNLAHYGDASTDTFGVNKRQRLEQALQDKNNGTFDAICISTGGNDIAGTQFIFWINSFETANGNPDDALRSRFDDMIDILEGTYTDLIDIRDQYCPNAVIFTNSYDFAIPSGVGVCGYGPWLKPSLDFLGWKDKTLATAIVKNLLLKFDEMLLKLSQNHPKVVHVPTQGTINHDEWTNELHPTSTGFNKITKKLLGAMQQVFPGRI